MVEYALFSPVYSGLSETHMAAESGKLYLKRPLTSEEKEQQFQLSLLLDMIGK